ncbi:MAG TPA: alpha/beta fold hydrolase [Polyangiaceae bacterium]
MSNDAPTPARRRRQKLRWAGAAAALVIVTGGLGFGRGLRNATRSIAPAKHPIPPGARADAFARFPDLRDVAFTTSDGLTLRGWFSPGTSRAAVILVHGGEGDRTQLLPEALVLARHGYGFLAYDSRASGESDGDATSWGDHERRDLVAALDFVSAQSEIDPQRIAVLGFSIGGTTAALVAASDARVRAAILAPVWTSLSEELWSKSGRLRWLTYHGWKLGLERAGVDVDGVRPIDVIENVSPRPVLLIAGTRDRDTPVPVMQRMLEAARQPASLWIVPGAEHGTYLKTAPAEYETRVVGFLDAALTDTSGR